MRTLNLSFWRFLFLFFIFMPALSYGVTFTVNSTADPGDGTCDATCTLRDAISAANNNGNTPDVDVIQFSIGLPATINLDDAEGQIEITEDLDIQGPGPGNLTIDAAMDSRIFIINDDSSSENKVVIISGLLFKNGPTAKTGHIALIRQ